MSEEEAFEHAIEMIQTRQMGFRKAADFFSVSKWKLYKTARKRGIYAEIKKQNQAQQALTKVPTNVQHFADMGVYKQLKKKTHLAKDALFPHLPPVDAADVVRKAYKAPLGNNNEAGIANKNASAATAFAEKLLAEKAASAADKPENLRVKSSDVDMDDEDNESGDRVLVINHRDDEDHDDEEEDVVGVEGVDVGGGTLASAEEISPDDEDDLDDSGRDEDSA